MCESKVCYVSPSTMSEGYVAASYRCGARQTILPGDGDDGEKKGGQSGERALPSHGGLTPKQKMKPNSWKPKPLNVVVGIEPSTCSCSSLVTPARSSLPRKLGYWTGQDGLLR